EQHQPSPRGPHPGPYGMALAAVDGGVEGPDARLGPCLGADEAAGAVGGAVVDDDQLPLAAGRQAAQVGGERLEGGGQPVPLVEGRDDDREFDRVRVHTPETGAAARTVV